MEFSRAMHFIGEQQAITPASLSFLYVILPLLLLVFFIAPGRYRAGVLLGGSLVLYGMAEPAWLLPAVFSAGLDYACIRLMEYGEKQPRLRFAFAAASIGKNILLALGGMVAVQLGDITRLPLGLLVVTISSIWAVAGMCREAAPCERSIAGFGLYLFFFPRLFAGPLISYREFSEQVRELHPKPREMAIGFGQFVRGAFCYEIFGKILYQIYHTLKNFGPGEASVLSAWCLVLSLALCVYYTLSGCCGMAQGLGNIFGFVLPRNFYFPYQSRSITDFFQRFNITVHALLWKLANRKGEGWQNRLSGFLRFAVIGIAAGFWFGLRINCLLWGIYLALFLAMEKYLYPGLLKKIPVFLRRIYALGVVLTGFTILAGDHLSQSAGYLKQMFYFSVPLDAARINPVLYLLSSNWLLLAAACLFATSAVELALNGLRNAAPRLSPYALAIGDLGILLVLTAISL